MSGLVRGVVSNNDFADRSFPFSWGGAPEALVKAIARVGMLQPPLLQETAAGGLRIVSGRRRLEALRRLAGERDEALEFVYFPVGAGDEAELFLRTLWENLALRKFNLGESAEIYRAAGRFLAPAKIEQELLPALGIAPRSRLRRRLERVAGMPDELLRMAAAERLDGESLELLAAWSLEDQLVFCTFAAGLKANRNKMREIVSRFDDLARRDRLAPGAVVATIGAAVADTTGPERVEKLRNLLREQLYPHLSRAEKAFATRREALRLPSGAVIEPPPFFEGGDFRVTLTFTSADEWRLICRRLYEIDPDLIDELCRRG
jgi:hypothetical protein